jgi:YfiH family protein
VPHDSSLDPGARLVLQEWEEQFPDLRCGITTASDGDYGISRNDPANLADVYGVLGSRLGFDLVAVGRQVHGTDVRVVGRADAEDSPHQHARRARREPGSAVWPPGSGPSGRARLLIAGELDGLVTGDPGVLLASAAADCVPVYMVDQASGAIGLVHAGWRGAARGILRRGVHALNGMGAESESLHIHLGPAICGSCYEVDAPVLEAFDLDGERARLDLRGLLTQQARRLGVAEEHISASAWCTRCSEGLLHSHRGGGLSAGRMAAYMGRRRARTAD